MAKAQVLYANSFQQQHLSDHLKAVAHLSIYLLDQKFQLPHLKAQTKQILEQTLFMAALQHDIGKAPAKFQNFLKKQIGAEKEEEIKAEDQEIADMFVNEKGRDKRPYHNEISWAAICAFIAEDNPEMPIHFNQFKWLVYHHHKPRPIFDRKTKTKHFPSSSEIWSLLGENTDADRAKIRQVMEDMCQYFCDFFGLRYRFLRHTESNADFNAPAITDAFELKNNDLIGSLKIMQSCLVAADWWVSKNLNQQECRQVASMNRSEFYVYFNNHIKDLPTISAPVIAPPSTDRDRDQHLAATECAEASLAVLGAPPGKGKTTVSLLWAIEKMKQGEINQLIYVLPRNSTAENLYYSLKHDMRRLGISLTMELFVSGTRFTEDGNPAPEFSSQIVVTNIDSLVIPFVRHVNITRLLSVCSHKTALVMDEYHELIQKNSIPTLTRILVEARHCNRAPTLFMSATPVDLRSAIAPMMHAKYYTDSKLAFDNPINFKVLEGDLDGFADPNVNNIVVCDTAKKAQNLYRSGMVNEIYHAKYIQSEKMNMIEEILTRFGANNTTKNAKVSATRLVESSLNASWHHVYEYPTTPESTIQRLGRCNRFDSSEGSFTVIPIIHEMMAGRIYTKKLAAKWLDFMKQNQDKVRKKSDFYQLREQFNQENKKEIDAWIANVFQESFKSLKHLGYVTGGSSNPQTLQEKEDINRENRPLRKNVRESKGYYLLVPIQENDQLTGDYIIMSADESISYEIRQYIASNAGEYAKKANTKLGKIKGYLTSQLDKEDFKEQNILIKARSPEFPIVMDNYAVYHRLAGGQRGMGLLKVYEVSDDNQDETASGEADI